MLQARASMARKSVTFEVSESSEIEGWLKYFVNPDPFVNLAKKKGLLVDA